MSRSKGFKKDRMYITHKEWVNDWGGKKEERDKKMFKSIQFYCCNLSLQPWVDPVCTPDGVVYDIVNIIPWLKKHKIDPVTGKELKPSDLIKLKFSKNLEGQFHCPFTYKVFTDFTHIVAVKQTGNVYAWEAIQNLNIKQKNWNDLIDQTPFVRADLITIQDPNDTKKNEIDSFYHIQKGLTPIPKDNSNDPLKNITLTSTSERIFKEIKEKKTKELKEQEAVIKQGIILPTVNVAPSTKNYDFLKNDTASFTCSAFTPKPATDLTFYPKKTDKKGFVTLCTNMGKLNIQLHCDLAPLACENFITLCETKYYNKTIFHRNIRHFMIQGGDPTATGKGGESIWKRDFPDEFHKNLKHEGPGIVAMANRGKDTNSSQFYITYKSAMHLNNKHTVFGVVVGGLEILKKMALVDTNDEDKPLVDIKILDTIVYFNPFSEEEMKKVQEEDEKKKKKEGEKNEYGAWLSNPQPSRAILNPSGGSLIGKYITGKPVVQKEQQNVKKRSFDFGEVTQSTNKKHKPSIYGDFTNFG